MWAALASPAILIGAGFVLATCALVLILAVGAGFVAIRGTGALPAQDLALVPLAALLAIALGVVGRRLRPYPIGGRSQISGRARLGALAFAVIAVGYELAQLLYLAAQNDPVGVFAVLVGAGVVSFGVVKRVAPGGSTTWWEPDLRRIMPWPILAVFVAALVGAGFGWEQRYNGELHEYCSYGAVSAAQLKGCLDHVTTDRVDALQTDAARFARGDINACLSDAGPFCSGSAVPPGAVSGNNTTILPGNNTFLPGNNTFLPGNNTTILPGPR
jgi:hypothetical protein